MTPLDIRLNEASQRAALSRAQFLKDAEARDRLVREALDAGWSHARIAGVTGLSRGRVGQIALQEEAVSP